MRNSTSGIGIAQECISFLRNRPCRMRVISDLINLCQSVNLFFREIRGTGAYTRSVKNLKYLDRFAVL